MYELAGAQGDKSATPHSDAPRFTGGSARTAAPPTNGAGSADIDASEPPLRAGRGVTVLLLAIALALAAIPMSLQLTRLDVTDSLEADAVTGAIHSWQYHHAAQQDGAFEFEWLIPYYNGVRRLDRAPGAYWMHYLAMATMNDPGADMDQLVLRLRLTSIAFALLTVAAVFWTGFSIGGKRAAFLAAMVCASMPLFIHHARLASPVIFHLSFAALAIGAATWAIRPLKPAASTERQLIGWIICGLSLGAATLTAGPIAAVTVVCPILLIMLLCEDRVGHLMGLLAALFMGVLLVLPWALYAHEHDSEVWQRWLVRMTSGLSNVSLHVAPGRRCLLLIAAITPWTLWAMVGLVQPISTSSKGQRLRLLLSGVWFVAVSAVLLVMPEEDQWRRFAPVLIPAAVLVGQLFNHYTDLAAAGRFARNWRWVRWAHLLMMVAASIILPLALYAQGAPTLNISALRDVIGNTSTVLLPAGWIVGLLAITALSARWAARNFPDRAATAWAVWAIALSCAAVTALTGQPLTTNPLRENAERLVALTGQTPVYWYGPDTPDARFTVYAHCALPSVQAIQLRQAMAEGQTFFVLSADVPLEINQQMDHVTTLAQAGMQLWHYEADHE